jgi:hypothetical protein
MSAVPFPLALSHSRTFALLLRQPASYALAAAGASPRRWPGARRVHYIPAVIESRRWSRPRLLLALLLTALVAGAVPVRAPASRSEKASGTSAWRAASARPVAPRPDLELRGFPPLLAAVPELLPAVTLLRAQASRPPRAAVTAPPAARSPLPRAPPLA